MTGSLFRPAVVLSRGRCAGCSEASVSTAGIEVLVLRWDPAVVQAISASACWFASIAAVSYVVVA